MLIGGGGGVVVWPEVRLWRPNIGWWLGFCYEEEDEENGRERNGCVCVVCVHRETTRTNFLF